MAKKADEIHINESMDSRKCVPSIGHLLLIVLIFISLHFSFLYFQSVEVKTSYVPKPRPEKRSSDKCPEHFRWIYEDLRPWRGGGIGREAVERAKRFADLRMVVLKGRVYVEKFRQPYQTRDLFSVWGILQLLRLYPDRIPDIEILLQFQDRPYSKSQNAMYPAPVFHYSKGLSQTGILFPDWTFWGWAEVNVRPWEKMLESIVEGNKKIKWKDREPYAYWKGNPDVNYLRPSLIKCNVSQKYDWNARLYDQNWNEEAKQGFKNSNIADQCTHRYKIYVEGWGWSVSEKYILACDSMVLFIRSKFIDFFSRSLVPMEHFWPITRASKKCRDIKIAVAWGNKHPQQAEAIGKAGSKFIQENLKMEYVYDYLFHVLNEYAKLMRFKPEVHEGAVEINAETLLESAPGVWRDFMEESAVISAKKQPPCTIPPPYSSHLLRSIDERTKVAYVNVEAWGDDYWDKYWDKI